MRSKTKAPEPVVPLVDLYQPTAIGSAPAVHLPADEDEQVAYMERLYDVEVVRDHKNRPAVSLGDAYKVRDARLTAEAELRDAWLLEKRRGDEIAAWAKARADFWYSRWMFALRATPIENVPNAQSKQITDARLLLSELVLAVEAAAGIPADVQAALSWPSFSTATLMPEPSERPEDYPYVRPETEEV